MLNLVFTNEQTVNHQNNQLWSVSGSVESRLVNQRQKTQKVMVWVVTATEKSHLVLVSSVVKINIQRHISYIMGAELLP